jgi:4-amino-4-deoxychorismate lyase
MRKIIYGEDKATIDEGLFFGKGVFETILWKEGPIFLEEHLNRLREALEQIGMLPLEEVEIRQYLDKLNINNKAVKITVTPLNIIITQRNIPYKEEDYNIGMNLTISKVRRNSTSRLCYIKSTCYIENLIEKEEAKKNGFDDVIFLNENGYVTETSCANIFIVKNNEIFTPRTTDGLLDGIIRRKIIENFKVQEKSITFEELKKSDEVIITNSLMGAMSIKKLDDIKYEKIELRDIFNKCIISI